MNAPVRVALAGCGAVAQLYYRPALDRLEREGLLRLIAAHDPAPPALAAMRAAFPKAKAATSFEALIACAPDLLIVASPPRFHAEQAIAALRAGMDVHCEKPLAPSLAEGGRMAEAAAVAGRRLSVGLLRRHFPATQAMRQLIANGALGEIETVDCFEGGPFDWPVQSAAYFQRSAGGAGILQDIGTHCLDLLGWWFGPPSALTYEDDAMGGVEANCRIALSFGDVRATVRLSRDWARPNRWLVRGSKGTLGWTANEANHFDYGIAGCDHAGNFALHEPTEVATDLMLGPPAADFDQAFANQLRRLIEKGEYVSAEDALPTLGLIDRCYASRQPMAMPWLLEAGA
jgi:predicted dehydrogenase